jgi:hypothetical protein
MIAYAPSIGVMDITDKNIKAKMAVLISRFEHLSVREDRGREIIFELTQKESELVLDPTLLLDSNDYDSLVDGMTDFRKEYLLCYFLGENEKYWRTVQKMQRVKNMSIKIIPIHGKDCKRKFEIALDTGPCDFLWLFKNASLICTDSFHGTIFSILYKKQFVIFERFSKHDPKGENSRIYNLLKCLSLEDRVVSDKNIYNVLSKEIDFESVDSILSKLKKKSIMYLENTLKKATVGTNENAL